MAEVLEKDIINPDPSAAALERVKVEKADLEEKVVKLQKMLDKQMESQTIADHSLVLMCKQLDVMLEYIDILNRRILYWGM